MCDPINHQAIVIFHWTKESFDAPQYWIVHINNIALSSAKRLRMYKITYNKLSW